MKRYNVAHGAAFNAMAAFPPGQFPATDEAARSRSAGTSLRRSTRPRTAHASPSDSQ